jgi:hypothetical protein
LVEALDGCDSIQGQLGYNLIEQQLVEALEGCNSIQGQTLIVANLNKRRRWLDAVRDAVRRVQWQAMKALDSLC